MKITTLTSLLLCFICANISAQSVISGQEISQRKAYSKADKLISNYQIFKIDVKKNLVNLNDGHVLLDLNLGNASYNLHLHDNNLGVNQKKQDSSMPLLLGGGLKTGGTASLTINDGFLYGYIKQGEKQLFIEPLSYIEKGASKDFFILYDVANVIDDKEHVCGVTEAMMKQEQIVGNRTITSCRVINIAIANTYDMITKYGNNTATTNHNLGVLNNVQTNYRSEFNENIEFNVVAHYFPTSASNDPLSPNTATNSANTLLTNFRDWARGPGNAGGGNSGGATGGFGIDYTMATLWTDRDIAFGGSTGTVGLAYTPGWHHLLEDYSASGASLMAMVTHEKGHNFSANHDASGSNYLMAPSVTLTGNWSTASVNDINNRLNSQNYLADCSTLGAPIANMNKGATAVCVGSTIEFEDQSQYGATRTWTFPGGSPTTSSNEKPSVTYNTAGLYPVSISSSNSAGTDTYIDYVDIEAAPPSPCTPSGGTGGSAGISLVQLQNLSNGSAVAGLYEDYACDKVASLDLSTTDNIIVGVQGVTRLRYFVDYNNDGDFLDADESSSTYTFSGNGNLQVPFIKSSNPVMESLLRMRVTVSLGGTIAADGCTAPTTGQVEDYSVYFAVNQVFGCTDPTAPNYNPNATVDDGSCSSGTATTWYQDADGDTYGNANSTTTAVTQPSGYVSNSNDCDDTNSSIYPGATEICDGQDNDCDGVIDEGVMNTYFADNDGDGYGNSNISTSACNAPSGYVTNSSDCDDNDANNYPGNTEICDGQDNDCDGIIDEGVMNSYFADNDGDGYGNSNISTSACNAPSGYVTNSSDCDDNDANNYPGNTEICDGQDNDCDGLVDEGVSSTTYYADADNDGYGNPAASISQCTQPSGYVTNNTDCDDSNAAINPGSNEVCDNIDNDCDNQVDEGVTNTYYADNDNDGYGDSNNSTSACSAPAGYVSNSTDCNDNNSSINPGAAEVCGDNLDNNCNGELDEGCNSTGTCNGAYLIINIVTQNTYRAFVNLQSTATINSSSDVLFLAGSSIDLLPGFEVVQGAEFEARIEPCTMFTGNPVVSSSGTTSVQNQILQDFAPDEEVNVTIINIDNIIEAGGLMQADELTAFLGQHMFKLKKGTYKLLVNNLIEEIQQDILVIK